MAGPAEAKVGPVALSSPERLAPGGPEWIRLSWTTLWKDRQNGPDKVYLPRTLRGWVREQGRLLGEPSRRAHAQVGPALGLMLGCPHPEILNVCTRVPAFSFCAGPCQVCSQACIPTLFVFHTELLGSGQAPRGAPATVLAPL